MEKTLSVLIVDDESSARHLIRSMLEHHGNWIRIAGEASCGKEAIELFEQLRPDLIFLDVSMPDLSGFEVLNQLSCMPDVIFTTANEQYALSAFQSYAVDYLLKPIRQERLDQSLLKWKHFGSRKDSATYDELKKVLLKMKEPPRPSAFPVRQGERILLFNFNQISHFEAADKYVFLFTVEGKKYLFDGTLTALEDKLPPVFIRIQKSFIINREKVAEIHKHFNGRFIIRMQDQGGTRIRTGQTFATAIKESFGL